MNARSGMRASAIPAMAPMSEVLAVIPSVTTSWTPMMAPTTQSGAISRSEPSSMKRGWGGVSGGEPVAWSAVTSLIDAPDWLLFCRLACGWLPTVIMQGGFWRDDTLRHVLLHESGGAGAWIAKAGAAGELHFDDLVGAGECDEFAGAAIMRHVALRIEDDAAHAAPGEAAVQALHRDPHAFGVDRGQRGQAVIVELPQTGADAAASAMLASAT